MFANPFPFGLLKGENLSSILCPQCLAYWVALTRTLRRLALACHDWSHLDLVDIRLHMSADCASLQSCRVTGHLWPQVTIIENVTSVARWHLDTYQDIGLWAQMYVTEMEFAKAVLATIRESCWSFRISCWGFKRLGKHYLGFSRSNRSSW